MRHYNVYQDGNRFYDDGTGDELFRSDVVVHDGNTEEARTARLAFSLHAQRNDFSYTFAWPKGDC